MNKELFEKGLAVRRAVVGDTYVEASLKAADFLPIVRAAG